MEDSGDGGRVVPCGVVSGDTFQGDSAGLLADRVGAGRHLDAGQGLSVEVIGTTIASRIARC